MFQALFTRRRQFKREYRAAAFALQQLDLALMQLQHPLHDQ